MTRRPAPPLSRRQLLHVGLGAGIATLLTWPTDASALAAAEPDDTLDLGLARLSASAELLAIAFYRRAIASGKLDAAETRQLQLALANEQAHYREFSRMFDDTDQRAPTLDDFAIELPSDDFRSRAAVVRLGARIEKAVVGIHLGSVAGYAIAEHRLLAARIAASDARHLALLSEWAANRPIGLALPTYIDPETAAEVLSRYLS